MRERRFVLLIELRIYKCNDLSATKTPFRFSTESIHIHVCSVYYLFMTILWLYRFRHGIYSCVIDTSFPFFYIKRLLFAIWKKNVFIYASTVYDITTGLLKPWVYCLCRLQYIGLYIVYIYWSKITNDQAACAIVYSFFFFLSFYCSNVWRFVSD